MLERLETIEARYDKLNELLSDPEVINDTNKLRDYSKEQSSLQDTVAVYREYKEAKEQLDEAKLMLEDKLDAEMTAMVKEEISGLNQQIEEFTAQLKILLLPKTRTTTRTLSSRFAVQQVETRRHFSLATFTVCTHVMQRCKDGSPK